jgi:hypothetical protein
VNPLPTLLALAGQPAEEADKPRPEEHDDALIAIGLHLGPALPVGPLELALLPRAEVGVMPLAAHESLTVFVTAAWTAPGASGSGTDARIDGSSYDWSLVQTEVQVGGGLTVRLTKKDAPVHPEISAAPQVVWMHTRADGTAAEGGAFGTTRETWVTWGVLGALGLGVDVGPGRLLVRGEATYSPLVGRITGDADALILAPTLGYRLML